MIRKKSKENSSLSRYVPHAALQNPRLRTTIRKELLSVSSLLIILAVSLVYIMLTTLLLNYTLLTDAVTNGFPLTAQFTIIVALLEGVWSNMHALDSLLLLANAVLVGVNLLLIGKTIYLLEHMGKVKVSIGGAALLSLVTTGCASCGLSLLSLFGLSSAFSFLPFHGAEIHGVTLGILLFSGFYTLKQIHNAKYCKIV